MLHSRDIDWAGRITVAITVGVVDIITIDRSFGGRVDS